MRAWLSTVFCPEVRGADLADLLAKGGFFHTAKSVWGVLKQWRIS
jgi:hypothetical protein